MNTEIPLDVNRDAPPAFIIVGRNGAGKSTLTNMIFGTDVAKVGRKSDVTLGVSKFTLPQSGVEIFDTPGHGGLNEEAEQSLRDFLQLDNQENKYELIPADMIIYVFTHERLTRQEFDFYGDIEKIFKDRIIVVKNYTSEDSKEDFDNNFKNIQIRTGKKPICVDALNGINVDELIREIFRFLTPDKLIRFNSSLEDRKRRARDLSLLYTLKAASLVAVIRSESNEEIKNLIESYKRKLNELIIQVYIEDAKDKEIWDLARTDTSHVVIENIDNERGIATALGGGLGMLIGILGGPIGVALGGLFGMIFGASSVKEISRGGTPAVINVISQGYGLSEIIEESFEEPIMLLTQSEDQIKKWLKDNNRTIIGTLKEATIKAEFAIKKSALKEYLNNPNTKDSSLVELKLRNVVDYVFNN